MNTETSISDDEEDGVWDDFTDEEDNSSSRVLSLFSNEYLPSVLDAVRHDEERTGFNFITFKEQANLDEVETIMLINFIRKKASENVDVLATLKNSLSDHLRPWRSDEHMMPFLENDGFLLFDWDCPLPDRILPGASGSTSRMPDEIQSLVQENSDLRRALQELKNYVANDIPGDLSGNNVDEHLPSQRVGAKEQSMVALRFDRRRNIDASYFESYAHYGIHREMLSDKARTDAYQKALEGNRQLLQGATVLDVGCGTGILSLFAARSGASRVIGVEGSEKMANIAHQILLANGLEISQGGPVSITTGQIEELKALPVEKVDIIVSEWMGYTLLFEAMLDTVIYARDRWLNPGGAVLPDLARLYLSAAGESALGTEFWSNVYGFDMRPMADSIWESSSSTAIVCEVPAHHLITDTTLLKDFDLSIIAYDEVEFSSEFHLQASGEACQRGALCRALVLWFDVEFSERFCLEQSVTLSTSPDSPQTHWSQTILPLKEPFSFDAANLVLSGRISIARSKEHRTLDISLEYVSTTSKLPVCSIYSLAKS